MKIEEFEVCVEEAIVTICCPKAATPDDVIAALEKLSFATHDTKVWLVGLHATPCPDRKKDNHHVLCMLVDRVTVESDSSLPTIIH